MQGFRRMWTFAAMTAHCTESDRTGMTNHLITQMNPLDMLDFPA